MAFGLLILIAVLQGLTEFLPVSSSGHLTLAAEWFDLALHGEDREAYFVLLHVASLMTICWWLRRDLVELITNSARRSELVAIAIGAVPAGALGLWLKYQGSGELFESLMGKRAFHGYVTEEKAARGEQRLDRLYRFVDGIAEGEGRRLKKVRTQRLDDISQPGSLHVENKRS